MSDTPHEKTDFSSLFESWLKNASEVWTSSFLKPGVFPAAGDGAAARKDDEEKRMDSAQTATIKAWQSFAAALGRPGTFESFFKGVSGAPDVFTKMTEAGWNGFQAMLENFRRHAESFGKHPGSFRLEDLDKEMLNTWTDLYDKEFRKFLSVPQLGLTRFHQERVNRTIDKFNAYQAAMAEFLQQLSLPVEKTNTTMQEKLADLAEKGELPGDPKHYYNLWIKILEGHYMALFKSPEYLRSLAKTLSAMEEYTAARQEVVDGMLQAFSIPTNRDMEEVYKEMYAVKRRSRKLEKQVAILTRQLQGLMARVSENGQGTTTENTA